MLSTGDSLVILGVLATICVAVIKYKFSHPAPKAEADVMDLRAQAKYFHQRLIDLADDVKEIEKLLRELLSK